MNKILTPIVVTILAITIIYGIRYGSIVTNYISNHPIQADNEAPKKCAGTFGTEDVGRIFNIEPSYQGGLDFVGTVKSVDCTSGETVVSWFENNSQKRSVTTVPKGRTFVGMYWDGEKKPVPKETPVPDVSKDKKALEKSLETLKSDREKVVEQMERVKELEEKLRLIKGSK